MVEACNVEDSPNVSLCFDSCPTAGVVLSFEGPRRNGRRGSNPLPPCPSSWSQLTDPSGQ
jgi:hypothetical protein